ncbi:hypothetical protein LOD99_14384 [Oopsacas minuta]|uniref:Uncharacterized protein n=1 Tax=Oopsacas minuta TaxID=111878 RepID=A0AAV7KFH8_9METZ|nr:hypothetical protein LOD99_14384 [Oopsacas minuta]
MHLFSKLIKHTNILSKPLYGLKTQKSLYSTTERLLYQTTSRFPARLIMLASLSQLVFWSYLSYIIMKDLKKGRRAIIGLRFVRPKPGPVEDEPPKAALKLRIFLSILSLSIGLIVFDLALLYATRQIQRLSLLENDSIVRIVTRNFLGNVREIKRPINCVKSQLALQHFPANKPYLPIKITDFWTLFSVDMKGHFPSRRQFDVFLHQPY